MRMFKLTMAILVLGIPMAAGFSWGLIRVGFAAGFDYAADMIMFLIGKRREK